jgi:hypothetical protein
MDGMGWGILTYKKKRLCCVGKKHKNNLEKNKTDLHKEWAIVVVVIE